MLHFATGGQMVNDLNISVGSGNSANLGSDLTVGGTLSLTGGSDLNISGQTLTIGSSGDITGTGSLVVNTSSDLVINSTAGIADAVSISGTSINSLTVNTGSGSSFTLANDLTINGTLSLQNGVLRLGGNDLTITGDVASGGSGTITSTSASDIRVTGSSSISGLISFTSGSETVGDFTINVGSGNSVSLGSNVIVAGSLNLNGGSDLNISGQTIIIGSSGDITGSGSLAVNSSSGLEINASSGIAGALHFSGSSMGSLTVNVGNGNSVTLGSDLMVSTLLDLQSGALVIGSNDLMIGGDIASGGTGTITSSIASNISVSGSSSPSGSLVFTSGGNVVDNFTVDLSGSNSSVMIGSGLTVNGTLTFNDGSINIGDNELSIGLSGAISGAGSASYVITGADGYLSIYVTAGGSGSVNFPVGTSAFYAPANISLNSGSSSGTVSVGVASDVWAEGTTGGDLSATQPLVDATWDIESDISSNLNMDIELMWSSAMEVNGFTNSAVYISHYTAGNWDAAATAAATAQGGGMFSIQRSNVTSLSPFAVFDQNTTTGVTELSLNSNFEIYPIPAVDNVSVRNITTSPGIVYVDMMNATGQLIKTFSMNTSNETVSLDGLSAGNYFLRFYNNDLNEVRKIIKR